MSWHGRWGKPDPYAKPARMGEVIGFWKVASRLEPDAHAGLRVMARCIRCGALAPHVLTKLRHQAKTGKPRTHRGCKGVS